MKSTIGIIISIIIGFAVGLVVGIISQKSKKAKDNQDK